MWYSCTLRELQSTLHLETRTQIPKMHLLLVRSDDVVDGYQELIPSMTNNEKDRPTPLENAVGFHSPYKLPARH